VLSWHIPPELEGKTLLVSGIVSDIPKRNADSLSFLFDAKKIKDAEGRDHGKTRMRLSWYYTRVDLRVGDEWELAVRLKRPHGLANLGSVDSEKNAFVHHVRATGYVTKHKENKLIRRTVLSKPIDQLRFYLSQAINNSLHQNSLSGFISALSVGIKNSIPKSEWQILAKTGTSHLMAISGLHIGLVAGLFYSLCRFFWRRSAKLCSAIPASMASSVSAVFGALLYSAMAGFALPTQRALIMILVFMGAQFLKKQLSPWQGFLSALSIIIFLNPLSTLSISFWLSFSAVLVIMFGMSGRAFAKGIWWRWGRAQYVVGIGLLPITLYFFQQIPLYSFLANTVAIPWVSFLVVPLCLFGCVSFLLYPPFGQGCFVLAEKLLSWLWLVLSKIADLNSSTWEHYFSHHSIFILSLLGAALILLPKKMLRNLVALVFFSSIVFH